MCAILTLQSLHWRLQHKSLRYNCFLLGILTFSAGFLIMQVVRQQEMLYDVDFRLQVMERHVARASGVRSDEETKKLNAKIAKLTQVLDGVNSEHTMLAAQVKKAEEDLSKCCAKPVCILPG